MSALVHVEQDEKVFCEREFSASFECGKIEITVRGESIGGILEIILNTVAVLELNPDAMMDLKLTYWHLTDDFDRMEVSASSFIGEWPDGMERVTVRRLAANAKTKLLKNLAQHHIALTGEKGEL